MILGLSKPEQILSKSILGRGQGDHCHVSEVRKGKLGVPSIVAQNSGVKVLLNGRFIAHKVGNEVYCVSRNGPTRGLLGGDRR
jgi:hypothetical protein